MRPHNGGPAFPTTTYYDDKPIGIEDGMSLRDYFAAKALTGIIAAFTGQDTPLPSCYMAATSAYDFADAMLKARGAE